MITDAHMNSPKTQCLWHHSNIHSFMTRLEWSYHSGNRFRGTVQQH